MSIIAWVFNWVCWNQKLCCGREYHNPTTKAIYWWVSFIFLCGLIACCISGIVITTRFGKYVKVTQCAYERVYYDSQFGQLKEETPKWGGLQNNLEKISNSATLVKNINGIKEDEFKKCFLDNNEIWVEDQEIVQNNIKLYQFRGKYYKPYLEAMNSLITECNSYGQDLYNMGDDDKFPIFYNYNGPDDPETTIGNLIFTIHTKLDSAMRNYEELENSFKEMYTYGSIYEYDLKTTSDDFLNVTEDFKNYKDDYLDSVEYYIKVAKGCGHILTIIYFCILGVFSVLGIILLLAYSYLKNQNHLDTFMHIIWNSIRFFELSFFLYGAAYGMLFKGLRDAIAYNMYLFGENLNEDTETLLLPSGEAKSFLKTCLTEKTAEFKGNLDEHVSDNLDDFSDTYNKLYNLLQNTNYSLYDNTIYEVGKKKSRLRLLQEMENSMSIEDDSNITRIDKTFNFTEILEKYNEMINQLYYSFRNLTEILNNQLASNKDVSPKLSHKEEINEEEMTNPMDNVGFSMESFDCSYLQNDLNLLYNALYDLSIESRILCAISCCIAFFSEIFVYFYLLSIYHYNCIEFREGIIDFSRRNRRHDTSEVSSKNEFMDKSRPIDMKKYNKKLDIDFSSK